MIKKSFIYARVSTDEQAKGYSLQTQIEACSHYCVEKGYEIIDTFQDDYTGASMDRPGLNQLREAVNSHIADLVIVYDVDRLARKSVYQMLIEEELLHQGVSVEYVLGGYTDTDEGRLQKQIRSSIAEYEKAKILERSKRGKRGKAKSGYVIVSSRPPYGYQVKSEPHKAWLEIDEEEADIVRKVYHWYVYGNGTSEPLNMQAIAGLLTRLHIPTRGDKVQHVAKKRGFGEWTRGMVCHILTNLTYTGVWNYGRTQMVSHGEEYNHPASSKRGPGKQVARDPKDWIPVEVPAIIDRDLFECAVIRRQRNAEMAKRNKKHDYLLSGRLRCTKCGYSYVGRTRREKHRYYFCNGHQQVPVSCCDMPAFNGTILDDIVWSWVQNLLEDPRQIALGVSAMQEQSRQNNQSLYDRLELVVKQLKDQEEQYAKLLDLYLTGGFSREILIERKNRLEDNINALRREQVELQAHLNTLVITDEQFADIQVFCQEIHDGIETVDFATKRQILDLLDVRGTLAIENEEKVIYLKCLLKPQQKRLSVALTSPSSSIGEIRTNHCAFRPMVLSR